MQNEIVNFHELEKAIKVAKQMQRPIEIDWVNRRIRVLSDVRQHPTKKMSDGKPMQWQDVICTVSCE